MCHVERQQNGHCLVHERDEAEARAHAGIVAHALHRAMLMRSQWHADVSARLSLLLSAGLASVLGVPYTRRRHTTSTSANTRCMLRGFIATVTITSRQELAVWLATSSQKLIRTAKMQPGRPHIACDWPRHCCYHVYCRLNAELWTLLNSKCSSAREPARPRNGEQKPVWTSEYLRSTGN